MKTSNFGKYLKSMFMSVLSSNFKFPFTPNVFIIPHSVSNHAISHLFRFIAAYINRGINIYNIQFRNT